LPNYLEEFKEERLKSINYKNRYLYKPLNMKEILDKALNIKKSKTKDITILSHMSKGHVLTDKTIKKELRKPQEITVKEKQQRTL
jgi:hypothetical protein